MPIQVLMPALSPTMTEGTLSSWLMKEGDLVSSGDVLCEIETDKATMEVEAVEEGILGKIIVAAGTDGVKVNAPIAIILEDGESLADVPATPTLSAQGPATPEPIVSTLIAAPTTLHNATIPGESRIIASPLARRIAEQAGVVISNVNGSGPNGRIVKRDVEASIEAGVSAITSTASIAQAPSLAVGTVYTVPEPDLEKLKNASAKEPTPCC